MKKYEFLKTSKTFRTLEACKTLRTNLMFCGEDIKVVVITSCAPNEGKSYITRNLAINLSEVGKKVLIIDADLRKSMMLGNVSTEEKVVGLSHYLSGQAKLEDIIFCNKKYHSLFTIFAGSFPPNPAELLESEKFSQLIKDTRENFDYVLIDTPPLGSVIDSAIVAAIADGAILVIRSGKTSYRFAKGVKEQLSKTGCRILGAVINGVDVDNKDKYYYKNYKNYYYSDYTHYYD